MLLALELLGQFWRIKKKFMDNLMCLTRLPLISKKSEHKTIPDPTLYLKPFLLGNNSNLGFKI